jgi:hypothetical protein
MKQVEETGQNRFCADLDGRGELRAQMIEIGGAHGAWPALPDRADTAVAKGVADIARDERLFLDDFVGPVKLGVVFRVLGPLGSRKRHRLNFAPANGHQRLGRGHQPGAEPGRDDQCRECRGMEGGERFQIAEEIVVVGKRARLAARQDDLEEPSAADRVDRLAHERLVGMLAGLRGVRRGAGLDRQFGRGLNSGVAKLLLDGIDRIGLVGVSIIKTNFGPLDQHVSGNGICDVRLFHVEAVQRKERLARRRAEDRALFDRCAGNRCLEE